MSAEIQSVEGRLLFSHIKSVDERGVRIEDAVAKLATEMGTLIRLTERQVFMGQELTRCFTEVKTEREKNEAQDVRLDAFRDDVKPLKETRRWMIGGFSAFFAALVTGFLSGAVSIHIRGF